MRRAPYQGEKNLFRFQPSPPTWLCFPSLRIVCYHPPLVSGRGSGSHGLSGKEPRHGSASQVSQGRGRVC